jgi:hypothetical protein
MKTYREILTEKTVKKVSVDNNTPAKEAIDKLVKNLPKGQYPIEFDGYKSSEADFTFKASLVILDDGFGWIVKKGAGKFYRVDGFKVMKSSTRRPNTFTIKDVHAIRLTI